MAARTTAQHHVGQLVHAANSLWHRPDSRGGFEATKSAAVHKLFSSAVQLDLVLLNMVDVFPDKHIQEMVEFLLELNKEDPTASTRCFLFIDTKL